MNADLDDAMVSRAAHALWLANGYAEDDWIRPGSRVIPLRVEVFARARATLGAALAGCTVRTPVKLDRTSSRRLFDSDALWRVLDQRRTDHGLSWKTVADETGISPSTFSKLTPPGGHPSAESLCRILLFLGDTDVMPYLRTGVDGS